MGANQQQSPPEGETEDGSDQTDNLSEREQLAGRVAVLEAQNKQLRSEYAQVKQTQNRTTALALLATGIVAAVGGVVLPSARAVLFALAGAGVYFAVLTYYFSTEQFIPASVGESLYRSFERNQADTIAELGLSETQLYVPVGEQEVRLYVPRDRSDPLPERESLRDRFVVTDESLGVAFEPAGTALFAEVEQASDLQTDDIGVVVRRLREALVEQFEIVETTEQSIPAETDTTAGEVSVGVTESAYGSVTSFDHPVTSLFGVGLARTVAAPVEVTVDPDGNDRVDAVLTCRWSQPQGSADG